MSSCYQEPSGGAHDLLLRGEYIVSDILEQDLDITMTVAGYRSIREDVYRNKDALKYNPHGVPPGPGEHAKL